MVNKQSPNEVYEKIATSLGYAFMDGSYAEIQKRLSFIDKNNSVLEPAEKGVKFPLIWLVTDLSGPRVANGYSYSSLIYIFAQTKSEYTTPQRRAATFEPILYPMHNAFLTAIETSRYTCTENPLPHSSSDMYFFGREENNKNPFGDFLDAIEIRNLEVVIYDKKC